MTSPEQISISDFTYDLPEDRIALRPLEKRDESRLLVYRNGNIQSDQFTNLVAHLPENAMMVFNNSKVIRARILFEKSTGGRIEVFCLEPFGAISDYQTVMSQTESSRWKCMIGGASKWKEPFIIKSINRNNEAITLMAEIKNKIPDAYEIEFSWTPGHLSFAEVLDAAGDMPLPPYIKRKTDNADNDRYQTIYAEKEGSVAAPTAGLHFTEKILSGFSDKGIIRTKVTLHVGAGTFKPVKAAQMKDHEMHSEWIDVSTETIRNISRHADPIIAVGTTSLRTIETLYWLGLKVFLNPETDTVSLDQWYVYSEEAMSNNITLQQSMEALVKWLDKKGKTNLFTQSQLLIAPGYQFKVAKGLVTNFHQPQSTLLLLVAAAIGDDWRKCYEFALENDFRFLSYGDSSLLFMAE